MKYLICRWSVNILFTFFYLDQGFIYLGGRAGRKLPPPKEASFPPKEITTKIKS